MGLSILAHKSERTIYARAPALKISLEAVAARGRPGIARVARVMMTAAFDTVLLTAGRE
jgi:hypothetical protein